MSHALAGALVIVITFLFLYYTGVVVRGFLMRFDLNIENQLALCIIIIIWK